MNAGKPLQGKIVAFPNDQHAPEKPHVPAFRGKISMPWEDMEHVITLWVKSSQGGPGTITGTIAALPYEQLASAAGHPVKPCPPQKVGTDNAPVVVDHRSIVLFANTKNNPKQPDYYGWAHSGQPTRPAVRIAVWARNDDNGRVYLIGNTEEHFVQPTADRGEDLSRQDRNGIAFTIEPKFAPPVVGPPDQTEVGQTATIEEDDTPTPTV